MTTYNRIGMDRFMLTPRETEVIQLAALGFTNKEIAGSLDIGPRTVKNHMTNIMTALDARNRTHAVILALQQGLVQTEES